MVWPRLRHFTATVRSADGQPPVNRRLQRPYLIRGWCLTKLNGFRFLKAAREDVRLNVHKWRDDVADSRAEALRKGLADEQEALSERF